jgi:polyadenylate-binding protein
MNNHKVGDKELQVLIHSKKDQRGDTGEHFTNLFVKNIPTSYTDEQLNDLFKEFGEIQSAKVKGTGSDSGFVMFKTHEQAQAAIDALN